MFRWSFPFRPRNPLLRLLVAALGVVVVLVLLAFSVFAVAALAVGGALVLLVNALRAPRRAAEPAPVREAAPGVIEGEFKIVHDARARSGAR